MASTPRSMRSQISWYIPAFHSALYAFAARPFDRSFQSLSVMFASTHRNMWSRISGAGRCPLARQHPRCDVRRRRAELVQLRGDEVGRQLQREVPLLHLILLLVPEQRGCDEEVDVELGILGGLGRHVAGEEPVDELDETHACPHGRSESDSTLSARRLWSNTPLAAASRHSLRNPGAVTARVVVRPVRQAETLVVLLLVP